MFPFHGNLKNEPAVLEFFAAYLNWDESEHHSSDLCKYNKHFSPETVLPVLLGWAFICVWRGAIDGLANKVLEERNLKDVLEWIQGHYIKRLNCTLTPHLRAHITSMLPRRDGHPGVSWRHILWPWESHFLSVLTLASENKKANGDLLTNAEEKEVQDGKVCCEWSRGPLMLTSLFSACSWLVFSDLGHGSPVERMLDLYFF